VAGRTTRYERAFEAHLARRGVPFVSIEQARRALLPRGAALAAEHIGAGGDRTPAVVKSFDAVLYGDDRPGREHHLLVEVKGRKLSPRRTPPAGARRLESWATLDDIESLTNWTRLFGPPFRGALVFLYEMPAGEACSAFEEVIEHDGLRYGVRAIEISQYRAAMKTRSPRWRTVDLPAAEFAARSGPLIDGPGALMPARSARGEVPSGDRSFTPRAERVSMMT